MDRHGTDGRERTGLAANGRAATPPRALDVVLALARWPSLASTMAARPVPSDCIVIIRIAASDEACRQAAEASGMDPALLQEAARLYVRSCLLLPGADCHRALGLPPAASRAMAREHMRWLLIWLHPDRTSGWDATYASRVIAAWQGFSREDGAAAAERPPLTPAAPRRRSGWRGRSRGVRIPWTAASQGRGRRNRRRLGWALVAMAATGAVALGLSGHASGARQQFEAAATGIAGVLGASPRVGESDIPR